MPETPKLVYDALALFYHGWKGADCFIGVDPLNCYVGLWLRRFHRVKKLVLYQIDFQEKRFANPLMNRLYHHLLGACVKESDEVWTMTERMNAKLGRGTVVPNGTFVSDLPPAQPQVYDFAFAGSMTKQKGIDLVLDALPSFATLLITGGGPYLDEVRQRAKHNTTVMGHIADHGKMLGIVSQARVGLATYNPQADSLQLYGDPGRVKEYIALGLPVIMTSVPEFAETVKRAGAGIVIPYDRYALNRAMRFMLDNPEERERMAQNAKRLSERFEYSKVFGEAIEKL